MSLALYRKYRPQTFKELIGQNHIKTTLQNELETGKLAHAYLFSGPRGLGKTTTARLLAKAVNCLKRQVGESEPCNQCEACQELLDGRSLDIIEIDAASHTGVDNVRENIINNSRFTPTSRKFKVFIIDEVHMLSTAAFNALLKTLEEPPAHAFFILATTEIHKVPQTIISRCQHFEFRKVSVNEIIQRLEQIAKQENKKVNQTVLENVAYYAEGCIRDAESLLGQILSLDEKEITLEQADLVLPHSNLNLAFDLITCLIRHDLSGAISLINDLVQDGVDLEKFAADLIEVLRKMLLLKVNANLENFTAGLNKDLEKNLATVAEQVPLSFLTKALEVFMSRKQQLKFSEIPQLPLELAVIEILKTDDHQSGDGHFNQPDKKLNQPAAGVGPKTVVAEKKIVEVKEEPKLKPEKPKSSINKVKITLNQVKEKWQEILICLKKYNQSLASTLKIGQPSLIDGEGNLEICFKHKFHQQRINDLKNRQILEKVLQETLGVPLAVKTAVVKEFSADKIEIEALTETPVNNSFDDILKSFGGQVVD